MGHRAPVGPETIHIDATDLVRCYRMKKSEGENGIISLSTTSDGDV